MDTKIESIHKFDTNLICEYFSSVERQGPGSPEMTVRAASFIDNLTPQSQIADLGCGTGGQTMVLANCMLGQITGIDLFPKFIDLFNQNAKQQHLQDRVKGVVGSMDDLPFQSESLDLIWSEGAIANIGFEKALKYWKGFLKQGGHLAFTYESWFTTKRPAEIEKWWVDAVPEINTIGHNISAIQNVGYLPVAMFVLPETCWTDNYFTPLEPHQERLLKKYESNPQVETFIAFMRREVELYRKYKTYYGYVFYICKKV